jgi:hypothetical protein
MGWAQVRAPGLGLELCLYIDTFGKSVSLNSHTGWSLNLQTYLFQEEYAREENSYTGASNTHQQPCDEQSEDYSDLTHAPE